MVRVSVRLGVTPTGLLVRVRVRVSVNVENYFVFNWHMLFFMYAQLGLSPIGK
jgi:hypothetical protein